MAIGGEVDMAGTGISSTNALSVSDLIDDGNISYQQVLVVGGDCNRGLAPGGQRLIGPLAANLLMV